GRNEVGRHIRRLQVAVLVVDRLLVERLRDALGEAHHHLAVDDLRVSHGAGVVDRDVAEKLHIPRLRVDFDDRNVRAGRPREVRRGAHVGGLGPRFHPLRQVVRRPSVEGELLERERVLRAPEDAANVLDLRLVDAEPVGSELLRLLADAVGRVVERDAADGEAATAVGVHPERNDGGVSVEHLYLVELVAEPIGDDLRPGGLVPLAVRRGARQHLARPGRQAADRGRVPAARTEADRAENRGRREAAHLDVGAESDAQPFRVVEVAARALLGAELLVAGLLEGGVEARLIVPRVDRQARRNGRWELLDEVAATDLDGIDFELAGQRVDRPLDRIGGRGPAGATVGVGRGRVREDARALEAVAVDGVRTRGPDWTSGAQGKRR